MRASTLLTTAAAVAVFCAAQAAPTIAAAQDRAWSRIGRLGHVYSGARRVETAPGRVHVEGSWRGDRGRGLDRARETTWGDGRSVTSVRRQYANGAEASWTQSRTLNGDGSATRERSHSGVRGESRSGWTTVYRSEDGFGRSQSYSSSTGRGGSRSTDVVVGDHAITVNRQVQTSAGRGRSSSRTYDRRN